MSTRTAEQDFLIAAWQFAGSNATKPETINNQLVPATWYHCQRDADGLAKWLESASLSAPVIESLLADDSRPRFEQYDAESFLMILRGINLNKGSEPDDMLSLRILWHKGAMISTRKVPSRAVSGCLTSLENGEGPGSLAELFVALVKGINRHISDFLVPVEETIDSLELVEKINVHELNVMQSRLLRLRRYLKPQKYVLEDLLTSLPAVLADQVVELRNCLDAIVRINESVEFYIDQITACLLSLSQQQTEKMNRNTYLFSLIAGIFLPATFFTGLLGVNIAGIPGTDNPQAFAIFCLLLSITVVFEIIILKKMRFI